MNHSPGLFAFRCENKDEMTNTSKKNCETSVKHISYLDSSMSGKSKAEIHWRNAFGKKSHHLDIIHLYSSYTRKYWQKKKLFRKVLLSNTKSLIAHIIQNEFDCVDKKCDSEIKRE